MSIMDIFRRAPNPNPAAPGAQQPPQQQPTSANGNPTVPSSTSPVAQGPQSPLANYADLWKIDPANQQPTGPIQLSTLNLDPAKLTEAASKLDFVSSISPELVQKALSGDAVSLMQVINQSSQKAFIQATMASGELQKKSMSEAQGTLNSHIIPAALRQDRIQQELTAKAPVFSDPAVAPMLDMLKGQFAAKYPTATPTEIADHAAAYLSGMATKIVGGNGQQIVTPKKEAVERVDTDWGKFFE